MRGVDVRNDRDRIEEVVKGFWTDLLVFLGKILSEWVVMLCWSFRIFVCWVVLVSINEYLGIIILKRVK